MNMFAFWICLFGLSVTLANSRSIQANTAPIVDARQRTAFEALESEFLKRMGLTSKPEIDENTVMPQYMLDLYHSRVEDENYVTTNLAFKDFSTTANTVRSFYHTDVARDDADGISDRRRKRRVSLDIASIPTHEELVKAEFRLYRNAASKLVYPKHIINVYQILHSGVGEESVKRLLDSRVVDANTDGWDSYDIFKAVQDWRERPAENYGLEIDIMSENGNPIDTSHLRFDKPDELDERMWSHHRPMMTVYTKDHNTHYHEKRTKRSSRSKNSQKGLCKRHELTVTFAKLNWTWVKVPESYPAYYCQGDCVYPLAAHMNTTNHAIVQTLVHNVRKFRTVPPACCIPTSYEPLAMLYFDRDRKPVLKNYGQMIVIGCGCR